MAQEYIEIRGARRKQFEECVFTISKRQITIFTGVWLWQIVHCVRYHRLRSPAAVKRNLQHLHSQLPPRYAQPDVDAIENLSMAIVVDQEHLGGGSHSTVWTITDIYSLLRLLYSRVGRPSVGNRLAFSFNDLQGMCPECSGMGAKSRWIFQPLSIRPNRSTKAIFSPSMP